MNNKIVRSEPLLETVYNHIKQDIVEGYYKQGEKLVTRVLTERYGVSDTPVKQALNRLVTEGLIEMIPRRGMRVKVFNPEDVRDMFRARTMIENYCIEECVKKIGTDKDLKQRFTQIIEEHRAFLKKVEQNHTGSDYIIHQHLDQEFHELIVSCAESYHIMKFYELCNTHVYMYQIYRKRGENEMWVTFSEHEKIYNQIIAENIEGAKNAMKEHINSFLNDMYKLTI